MFVEFLFLFFLESKSIQPLLHNRKLQKKNIDVSLGNAMALVCLPPAAPGGALGTSLLFAFFSPCPDMKHFSLLTRVASGSTGTETQLLSLCLSSA